jgi:RecB family exonuclease
MAGAGASRRVRLRGKVDRVDLLEDGRFRLIDYKNGKLPEAAQTIQLPIYAACVQQQLARTGKGRWVLAEAGYLAFGDARPDRVVIGGDADAARKMAEGQQRLLDAIDRIERGEFPPRPASPRLCGTCAYAAVCRKDFVDGD